MERSHDEILYSCKKGNEVALRDWNDLHDTLSLQSKVQSVYSMLPFVWKRRDLRLCILPACAKRNTEKKLVTMVTCGQSWKKLGGWGTRGRKCLIADVFYLFID